MDELNETRTRHMEGGLKQNQTIIEKLGSEEAAHKWRQEIGRRGGQKSRGGGFASRPGLASEAGRKGGSASGYKWKKEKKDDTDQPV